MTANDVLQTALAQYFDGNIQGAIATYEASIANGAADHPDIYGNLGAHLFDTAQWARAEQMLRRALELHPENVSAMYNLGSLLHFSNRAKEAQTVLTRVLELQPDHIDCLVNLAGAYAQEAKFDVSLALLRRAQAINPLHPIPRVSEVFQLTYLSTTTDQEIGEKALAAGNAMCGGLQTKSHWPLSEPWAHGDRPLRVGMVSGDLKDHPVGYFLRGWMSYRDPARVTLHAYSMLDTADDVAAELRTQFDTWHSITGVSDERVKAMLQAHKIDVLIDLAGYTALHRLSLFALRAAPVQISWLGWFATTGLVNMDFMLTDHASAPGTTWAHCTEHLLNLPQTRLCMEQPKDAPDVAQLPALTNGYLSFGSVQIFTKLSDETLQLWAGVLHALPSSRLKLRCRQFGSPDMLSSFQQKAAQHGLPLARVDILSPTGYEDYLAGYNGIDIMLDTTPFPGGTTTAEALWMGVPTITLCGNTMISRQGASMMGALGLPNWVVHTQEGYVDKARYWSVHLEELAALRQGLREQARHSPLFDAPEFARVFASAIETAVTIHKSKLVSAQACASA